MEPANIHFTTAFSHINLGRRTLIAKAAHEEVRNYLSSLESLTALGLSTTLIGSYPRDTAIWPGKDVDVFAKFEGLDITSRPDALYSTMLDVLVAKFGERVTPQNRSIKIAYRPETAPARMFLEIFAATVSDAEGFEFSVDVVPAVRWGERWGIPDGNRERWHREAATERWRETDPETLTVLGQQLNKGPLIGGDGVYVPLVKVIKQIRKHHLAHSRPGGFFYELLMHEAFAGGQIEAPTWPEAVANSLTHIERRLRAAAAGEHVCDPALDRPYQPAPDAADLLEAAARFGTLARAAEQALAASRCEAAAIWRTIFGQNGRPEAEWIFPIPAGCTEDGKVVPVAIANPLKGTDEARGFGSH